MTVRGVAGLASVGYVGARRVVHKGVIDVRIVCGEELNGSTVVGSEQLFMGPIELDGSYPDRRFHPGYRRYFSEEPPMTGSRSAHQELQQGFDRVVYALSRSCPDAYSTSPRVSRHEFIV